MKRILPFLCVFILIFRPAALLSQEQQGPASLPKHATGQNAGQRNMWDLKFSFYASEKIDSYTTAGGIYIQPLNEVWMSHWNDNQLTSWTVSSPTGQVFTNAINFTIDGVSGVRAMTFDGNYLYAVNNTNTILVIDPYRKTLTGNIVAPIDVRYITFDPTADQGNGGFWVGNYETDVLQIDYKGTQLTQLAYNNLSNTFIYASAFDNISPGGPFLWLFGRGDGVTYPQVISQINLANHTYTGIWHDASPDFTQYVDSTLAAGLFLANGIVPGVLLLCGIIEGTQDILFAYDIGTVNNVPVVTSLNRSFSFEDPKASSSYRIVGLPGDINLTAAQFMGQAGEHKKDWNIYYDNGQNQNYLVEYNNSDNFTFKPGRAFWMLSRNPVNLSMQTNMVSTDFNSYTINLQSGWNLISSPFLNGVSWSAVKTANNLANNALIYSWNGAWSNPQTMSPYEGYYFNNINNLRALRIPDAKMLPKTNPAESYGLERSIKISLRQDGKEYSAAFAAVNEKSSPGYDDFDYFCPPSDFSTLNIFIRNENLAVSYKNLFIDSRPPESEGDVFDLEIKNQSGKEAVLGFEGLESFTASQVFLEDVLMGKFYDLKNDKEIKIDAEHGEKRYNLVIGKAEFIENLQKQRIPLEYGLLPNYPNPFNPASKISYMLPKAGYAVIKVFDITGREVVTLAEGMHEAGRYEVTFDGSHLASGVYFYQLRSGSFTQTRNMFLLK